MPQLVPEKVICCGLKHNQYWPCLCSHDPRLIGNLSVERLNKDDDQIFRNVCFLTTLPLGMEGQIMSFRRLRSDLSLMSASQSESFPALVCEIQDCRAIIQLTRFVLGLRTPFPMHWREHTVQKATMGTVTGYQTAYSPS